MVTPSFDDDKTRGTGGNGGGGGGGTAVVCVVDDAAVEAEVTESNASGPNTRIVVADIEAPSAFVLADARSESRC